jgi:uncharacterized phage protein (TIGR02218 family)
VKTYSIALRGHINSQLTTLATCILMTRTDGNIYGFTTHDKQLLIDGVYYESAAGFNPTDIASNSNIETDNVNVTALLDSASITEDDLRAGRWDYAAYRIFQVNWSDLSMGDKKDSTGHLGEVTVNRQTFAADLLGLMEAYGTSVGAITQPGCRNSLGDLRCGIDLGPLTVTGTISACASDLVTLTDGSRAEAVGYFNEGIITIEDGPAAGLRYEIKEYTVGQFITKIPIAYDVTGAAYTMTAGCDRLRETCRDRFSNVSNFNGEPWLRGMDALVQIGRHT